MSLWNTGCDSAVTMKAPLDGNVVGANHCSAAIAPLMHAINNP